MISIRRVVLAAACLLAATAVTAAPAGAFYYPSGPQVNVDKSQLEGWQQCFSGTYGDGTSQLAGILSQCDKGLLLLAGGPTDSSTLTVLAAAPRADVLFDTGQSNTPTTPTEAAGTSMTTTHGASPSRVIQSAATAATSRPALTVTPPARIRTSASAGIQIMASSPAAIGRAR